MIAAVRRTDCPRQERRPCRRSRIWRGTGALSGRASHAGRISCATDRTGQATRRSGGARDGPRAPRRDRPPGRAALRAADHGIASGRCACLHRPPSTVAQGPFLRLLHSARAGRMAEEGFAPKQAAAPMRLSMPPSSCAACAQPVRSVCGRAMQAGRLFRSHPSARRTPSALSCHRPRMPQAPAGRWRERACGRLREESLDRSPVPIPSPSGPGLVRRMPRSPSLKPRQACAAAFPTDAAGRRPEWTAR